MKNILNLTLFSILTMLICISCKSKNLPDSEERVVIIELKKKYNDNYISTNYETYKPIKVKRSNRTLNQYTSTFSLDDVWYKGLINRLNEDSNVIKIIEIKDSGVDKPFNSQNQQRSSATPVIKKSNQ